MKTGLEEKQLRVQDAADRALWKVLTTNHDHALNRKIPEKEEEEVAGNNGTFFGYQSKIVSNDPNRKFIPNYLSQTFNLYKALLLFCSYFSSFTASCIGDKYR